MGRSRGGLTTKIHACVDTNGMPVRLELTTGEAHDNRLVTELLSDIKSGAMLLADRGYDADWIRAFAGEHGAWANIPPKRNRKDPICFSPYLYRARNLVERFFNRIKQCRRVATRYDNSPQTTLPSSSSQPFGFGYALMSPRRNSSLTRLSMTNSTRRYPRPARCRSPTPSRRDGRGSCRRWRHWCSLVPRRT